jgi:Ca-activated chloride channel homolog
MIGDPRALLLLLMVIPMGWISYRRHRRSVAGVVAVAGGSAKDTASLCLVRWFFSTLSYMLAFVLGVVALSDVQWGRMTPAERPAESETIFLIDVSRSMLADDVKPSRLELSTAVIRNVIDDHPGGSFGIVLFKGDGYVFLPVTRDYAAMIDQLTAVDYRIFTSSGTNLEAGLSAAYTAFPGVRDVRKNIVLFTDGDVLDGDAREIATQIGASGIELTIVAAGRTVPIQLSVDDKVVLDASGNPVQTAVRMDVLDMIRVDSGGTLFSLDDGDVVERLGAFVRGDGRPVQGRPRDRYRLFLGWGLVFIVIWVAIRTVRWRNVF